MGLMSAQPQGMNSFNFNPIRPWQQGAPAMPQQTGGLMGAFANNPAFQQQLAALMGGEGPGRGPIGHIPPITQIDPNPPPQTPPRAQGQMMPLGLQWPFPTP